MRTEEALQKLESIDQLQSFIRKNTIAKLSVEQKIVQLTNITSYLTKQESHDNNYQLSQVSSYIQQIIYFADQCINDIQLMQIPLGYLTVTNMYICVCKTLAQKNSNFILRPIELQLSQIYNLQKMEIYAKCLENINDNTILDDIQSKLRFLQKQLMTAINSDDIPHLQFIYRCMGRIYKMFERHTISKRANEIILDTHIRLFMQQVIQDIINSIQKYQCQYSDYVVEHITQSSVISRNQLAEISNGANNRMSVVMQAAEGTQFRQVGLPCFQRQHSRLSTSRLESSQSSVESGVFLPAVEMTQSRLGQRRLSQTAREERIERPQSRALELSKIENEFIVRSVSGKKALPKEKNPPPPQPQVDDVFFKNCRKAQFDAIRKQTAEKLAKQREEREAREAKEARMKK